MHSIEPWREEAMEFLSRSFANDHISIDEYERRLDRVNTADSIELITRAIEDLPGAGALSPTVPEHEPPERGPVHRAPASYQTDKTILTVLGSRTLRGDWLRNRHATSVTLLGSSCIDLRECDLPSEAALHVVSIMGECQIEVPEGVEVINSVTPVLAEVVDKTSRSRSSHATLRVTGIALMSEVKIRNRSR